VYGLPLTNKGEQTNWTGMHYNTYPSIVGTYGSHMDVLQQHIYHENTNQQVVRYKTEELDRWVKHAGLVERIHAFQTKHFEDRQSIGNLNYESKHCWDNLAEQYIIEAASPIQSEMYTLSEFLGARLGVG
jgi:hypothetical protein